MEMGKSEAERKTFLYKRRIQKNEKFTRDKIFPYKDLCLEFSFFLFASSEQTCYSFSMKIIKGTIFSICV